MQKFVVPQFIDVENKIIGPITVRQFIIFMVALVMMAIAYRLMMFTPFLIFSIFVFFTAVMFAFVKINGAHFHFFVLNIIQTLKKPKTRVWNNRLSAVKLSEEIDLVSKDDFIPVKRLYKKSRLAELSLIVDTQGHYQGEDKL